MKITTWTTAAALLFSGALFAQDQKREMPKPGKQHEALKYFEGTWDTAAKFQEPGKPPMESKGSETATYGMGGFWLTYEYKGEMMGKPFTGHGAMGYDQQKQKYVGVWIDSTKSGLFTSEGTADPDGKRFTMTAQGYCDSEGRSITMKQVHEIKDKDHWTLHFLTPSPDGKDQEVGTIEYTRRT